MFVRYGQAAMMAAIMTLAGNTVWAQTSAPQVCPQCPGYANYFQFGDSSCMSKKYPCKDGECCSKSKKCDEKCTCGKDNKCECCKGDECGCDKCGCKKATCGSCPVMHKLAKRVGIIMIMPASMPLPAACCMEAMGMLPHPPLPPPHMLVPPPLPPPVPFPHTVQVNEANAGNVIYGYGVHSNCGLCGSVTPAGPPSYFACGIAAPAAVATIRITAMTSSEQLEMTVCEGASVRCKKMTVTIGENKMTVSRFDDRVRIRGEGLKATASSVCTDGKDRLILEGDVVLRYNYENAPHSANVTGERIELNLSNNTMTIQPVASPASSTPERVHGGIEP